MDRRKFIKAAGASAAGLSAAASWPSILHARRPAETISVAVMGVNSRGSALADGFARATDCVVRTICDVDSRAIDRVVDNLVKGGYERPRRDDDVRRVLEDPAIDALVVAAPDHWHAPVALMALQAGKHVYLEKPCSHSPAEGELLVAAQAHYGHVLQMGNQQRSAPESIEAIDRIRDGLIGRPYFARAWYANTRGPIGKGQEAAVPDWLNYELWQGPAPRTGYRDNVVHYNWHWFKRWGTGEICNNGTHEIDVCRWALGVDTPTRVVSTGGRFHYHDDWEFYDTQLASFEFGSEVQIVWDGRSCNGYPIYNRGRGASIHGTEGTVIMDRDGYLAYDQSGKEIARRLRSNGDAALDVRGGGSLTDLHIENFLATVRGQATLNAPIHDARKSQLLCHLGNIAQDTGRTLEIDEETGRIHDRQAMRQWGRDYEPGWEMKL